ncbi:MAG: fasciclin domain-containing protein [Mycobacterium sp.]
MRSSYRTTVAAAAIAATSVLGLAACANDTAAAEPESTSSAAPTSAMAPPPAAMSSTMAAEPAGGLIGSGCAAYAEQVPEGPGSVAGMAQDPVTVAASNNPVLTTLTSALSGQLNPDVNLVDTLNAGEFTVFAPTDDAFSKLDAATVESLKTDSELLTSILTYHVVEGQASPAQVVGEHTTLQGGMVTVTGSGDGLMVNNAGLVCGGVSTANAQVYMIDTVLMPPAA